MTTKIRRGLAIISDFEIKTKLQQGVNKTTIEGAYLELNPSDNLSCIEDLKKNLVTEFEKTHFSQSEIRLIEIKGNTIINQELETSQQLILCVEQNSNIEINISGETNSYLSSGLSIHIHENANANIIIKSELKGNQNYLRITQKQEQNTNLNIALKLYSSNQTALLFRTNMEGENSSIDKRVFIKAENSQVDSEVKITHNQIKTKSNMVVNGILLNSQLINENNIRITKKARDSQGYEHSKFILLDEKSNAVSIPNLEIENNEVSCSHGSTISSINDEELFYLQSRGINKENAIGLIINGLEESVIEKVVVGKEQNE